MRPMEVLDPLLPGQIHIDIDGLTGEPEIQFGTALGSNYLVEQGEDLGNLTPRPGPVLPGTGMTLYLSEPAALPRRFHRIVPAP